jgi:hypothetical protein
MARVRGNDHVRTAGARTTLARTLTGLGKFAEAETELIEVDRALSAAKPPSPSRQTACAKAFIELYEQWNAADPGKGFDAKAAQWKSKLPAITTQPAAAPSTAPAASQP